MHSTTGVQKEGYLRKKGSNMSIWGSRYFVLRGSTLLYFSHSTDTESKGRYYLKRNCRISPIREEEYKRKKQYVFSIICPLDGPSSNGGQKDGGGEVWRESKADGGAGGRGSGRGDKDGTLMSWIMGSDKGSTEIKESAQTLKEIREREVILAADTRYDAQGWVLALENQIALMRPSQGTSFFGATDKGALKSNNKRQGTSDGLPLTESSTRAGGGGAKMPPAIRIKDVSDWIKRTKWTVADTRNGIRYYCKEGHSSSDPACARVNISMGGSSTEVLKAVLAMPSLCQNGPIEKIRVVERLDTYVDIVQITCREMKLQPSMVGSRDFCVLRYWKQMSDGSFVVCLDSTFHRDCPVVTGRVRGEIHAAYIIAPPKESVDEGVDDNETDFGSAVGAQRDECLLSFVCQIDPKGWLWHTYYQLYLYNFLSHIIDVRDTIDMNKFSRFRFDPEDNDNEDAERQTMASSRESEGGLLGALSKDSGDVGGESESKVEQEQAPTVYNTPPPLCPPHMFAEPPGDTFMLRGPTYLKNKKKQASEPNLFKFICIDMYHVPEATHNLCSHPNNRVYKALQRGDDTWVFCMNIMVPSSPPFSFVAYWEGDRKLIEADTPFGRVARPFFDGNDDEFRNSRFKLIPKVVEGNYFIRMAVKDTPTLLGNKLKQYYYRGDNYFEVDVDVGSSTIANNTVGLCIGVSTAIVVDMGICLQGNEEDELPEVMVGACSCVKVDTALARPL